MTELQRILLNLLLYIIATIVFKKKFGWGNLATVSMLLYTISALFSLFFYITPFYLITESYKTAEFTLIPALWLYAFNVLLCLTLRRSTLPRVLRIRNCDINILNALQVFTLVIFLVIIIFGLPSAIHNFLSNDLADLRSESGEEMGVYGPSIVRLFLRFFGAFSIFLLVMPAFNFFVLKRKRTIDFISLFFYLMYQLEVIANSVSRATILFLVFQIVALIICLREYIPRLIIRRITLWFLPILGAIFAFFVAISYSRFSEGSVAATEELQVGGSFLRYAGEGQLNFNIMMYERTKGYEYFYNTFPLYRRLMGLPYAGEEVKTTGSVHSAYTDRIHPYPNNIFYQAAGRWYIDLGKYIPIILLVLLNLYIKHKKRSFSFTSVVVLALWSLYVMAGIFWAQYGSEPYNVLYVVLLLLHISMSGKSVILPQATREFK